MNTRDPGNTNPRKVHNRRGIRKSGLDGWPAPLALPALDLLSNRLRQQIMWALAHEARTPTALARDLGASQPLISKHLAILRAAGLVEARRDFHDHRARVYDIRREQLVELAGWLDVLERNWHRRHVGPDYYKTERLDPNRTTRGTPRKRIPRALKEPWER
jgi:DNA-binding transcriptional ArsR family regulator